VSATTRAAGLRRLLTHARDKLGMDIGFALWDGSTVPETLAADALTIRIADEGAVAALLRRPNLDTLGNLWVSERIDLQGGTIFDLVARRPKVRSRALLKSLDKMAAFRALAPFLLVGRGGPWPLETVRGDKATTDGSAAANQSNVSYHYDVSDDFYKLFLDKSMVYSCAYFTGWGNTIDQAQFDKLDMICRKLRLKPGETLLDIGCGWGALVLHAARHYGVRATGVTLSKEQFATASERVAEAGLSDRITLQLRDYASLDERFDKISSIGMFEHVGIANHPRYFQAVNRLLNPGGLYLHHAIARPAKRDDRAFNRRPKEYAALLRYIFPGGELDHVGMSIANLQRYGFEVHDMEAWREHYARTCRFWHDRLLDRYAEACAEIGSVKTRLWLVYLAGCSLAFERNTVGIYQTLASKRVRGPAALPPTRADLYAR